MRLRLLLMLLMIGQLSYGQNMFTKGIAKLAKKMGGLSTMSTSTLGDVVPTVGMGSNLHPVKLGTMSQAFFSDWKTGGDLVYVMLSKKNQPGFYKVDGTVTIDGQPVEYLTSGMYGIVSDASDAPRKVEIITSGGDRTSFTLEPSKKRVKLLSINGQSGDKIALDLTKDVTLELQYPAAMENSMMKVTLAITQLSMKSTFDVCYAKIGSKVVIPASAFRNINIKPGGTALFNYKNSYLSVGTESTENAKDVSGSFSDLQYTSSYDDGMFVTVTGEPTLNPGLTVKGTDVDMDYSFYKPNAFLSRPFEHVKKIGLLSFAIRGTTYHQSSETDVSTSSSTMGGIKTTTTTTRTKTTTLVFPQQPNEVWDALLESVYVDFKALIESELNATIVTPEKITGTEGYKRVEAFSKDDANTKVEFSRSFRDNKIISAFMPLTEGYGVNGANERIMNESGTDALLIMTMDLQISEAEKSEHVLMIPKMAFEIVGKTNGLVTNTKYLTGTIQSSAGVSFKKDITPAELNSIIRKSDMMMVFKKALRELKEKEIANGDYTSVWNIRK
ncbi:MAG: hypothetical protein HOP08_13880 [Cyclobacteriaceae bacterium]|nr:hypothetical protein [Cyclobacteriaceae bacterium]